MEKDPDKMSSGELQSSIRRLRRTIQAGNHPEKRLKELKVRKEALQTEYNIRRDKP